MSPDRRNSSSARGIFGAELKHQREKADLTQKQLGDALSYSDSQVGAVETGQRKPSREFAVRCDEILGADGILVRLWKSLDWDTYEPWFLKWIDVEREARVLKYWQSMLVPGLLQTPAYARAVIARQPGLSEEQIEELVTARMGRKETVFGENPPLLWVVMDEGVLHRPIGEPSVMCGQLQALIDAAARPNITVQIVPLEAGGSAGLVGAFVIATLPGGADTLYLESAAEGYVTDDPQQMEAVRNQFEAIRADALPARASLDLIAKVMKERWAQT